jgi:hypothetical protein
MAGLTRCNRVRCPNCGFENVPLGGRSKSGKSGSREGGRGLLSRLFGGRK